MNKEEARLRLYILELEDALDQAQHTIEFLHGCLVHPEHYSYQYPEQTIGHLHRFAQLHAPLPGCLHSVHKEGCEACSRKLSRQRYEAMMRKEIDKPD